MPKSPTPGLSTKASTITTAFTTGSSATTPKQRCEPEKNVVFLKTHKTGSSTITNILNRYADWNNLTMLLPKDEAFYSFNWPNKFRLGYARDNFGQRPNILANHARYSQKSLAELFPRDKTAYVTILRDPVKQWESTFSYMSFPYILNIHKKKDPLDFFFKNPPSFQNIKKNAIRFPSLYLIKNPLFFDLGLDYKFYENATMIRRAIKALDNDFNLVLMMEHFDESMVLMKRRLCWDMDDVVFFKTNERLNKNKRRVLTEFQQDSIKSWNSADVALYNFFVDKFWKEIEKEGLGFYDDLEELRSRKKYYYNKCIEKEAVTEAYTSVFVKGYEMRKNLTGNTKLFCERMLRNELSYQDYFKDRYIEKLNSLEGVTIENFENQLDEAEIEVEISENWGEVGNSYDYGLPTKRPRPPPSKVTILKTRVQKQKEKASALKAKQEREKRKKLQKAGRIVNEKVSSGDGGKNIKKNSDNKKLTNSSEKSKIVKEREGSGSAPKNPSNEKNKTKIKETTSKSTSNDKKAIEISGSGEKTIERTAISSRSKNTNTHFTAESMAGSKKSKNAPTEQPVKSIEKSVVATRRKTTGTTPHTPNPTKLTVPITFDERMTTLAKHIIELETPELPEMTSEPLIKFTDRNKNGSPMKSANTKLKMDDTRRYDGKTIIAGRKKVE